MKAKKVSLTYNGRPVDAEVRQAIDQDDGGLYNIVDDVFYADTLAPIRGANPLRFACQALFYWDGDVAAALAGLEKSAGMCRAIKESDAMEIEAMRIVRDEITVSVESVDVNPSDYDNE
jgi:hypothetical protein